MMSVTLSKSASTQSVNDDSPTKETPKKKERNALSQKFTKISLFGRKLRGKETNSTTLTKDQLQDYLNSQANHEWDDTSSMSEEEGALILWEEDGNVKAATPVMLVRRITDEKFVDSNLLLDVIVSYRSFATPAQFMDLLFQRFEVSSPISLRVCAVLKTWIERQWGDFDSVLADSLVSFVRGTVLSKDILKNVAEQLLKLVEKKKTLVTDDGNNNNNKRAASLSNPPKPLLPLTANDMIDDDSTVGSFLFGPSVTVWSFPGKEVARQLTLLEQKLYLMIQPKHLIDQAWAKHPDLAPPVVTLINHFNKVSAWACTEIVSTADLQQRIERVLQMIEVAQNFFSMNNFNGLMAVLAGLHSSSVHRLKRTWAAVPEKSKETFEFLTKFMSSAKNYSQYREYLQKAQLPVLPYLGVCLTDLTFIEDGNPAEIGHLVNFSKCRQIAAVIRKMQEFQSVSYDLIPIPFVQNYFNTFAVIDEKAAYESSTKIEPRTLSTQVSASQMSAAVASVASSAFASLTSSMGIDKEYDLCDTSELVEGEFVIDTMHTRFKKDLIRSRNNSLNIGEPFPAKVQLPGSLPVEMRMPANTTAKQAVKHFANFFSGLNEQYCLVVMPCKQDPKGYVFTSEELVKEVLRNRENNQTTTKLALFASPLMVSSAVFSGSSMGDCRDFLVDLGVPLFSMFPLFQETFFGTTEEITFLAYDKEAKQAWWMNTHKSLEANHFSKSCILIVYPISNLLHASADSMAGGDKQGMLLSGGREGTLKVATVKTVTAILSGPFLLCYKNKHDAAPTDVIALDRYTVQCSSAKHVSVLLEKNPIFPAPCTYSFAADMDSETRAWLRALQRNRGVLGDKVVFGEDLNKTAKQHIPVVLQKTVNFINSHALQVEGLFKPHTNSSLVQHYKNQFDSGVDVEFTRTNDAGTVAQLLLMFFEELPDPLLSYELFPKFVEFAQKPPPLDEEANALRDIVSNLSYPHKTVLAYLLAFLSQVSIENPIKNGIVNIFGPWLLRAPPNEGEPKGFKEIARSVTGKLIKHREKIFIGLSRRPEASAQEEDPKLPASSNMPNNTNPQCTEAALLIDKQLQNNAAIAKKVELLKSQLENKYNDNKNKYENKYSNKYKKPTQLKRQVSFHDDLQQNKTQLQTTRSSPAYHRTAKSVSYVTTTTYDPAAGPHKDHEVVVPIFQHLLGHDVQVVDSSPSEGSDISLHTDPTDFTDRSSSDPSDPPDIDHTDHTDHTDQEEHTDE